MNGFFQLILIAGIFFMIYKFFLGGGTTNKSNIRKPFIKKKQDPTLTMDDHYNTVKFDKKKELDRILEKIHKKGFKSITTKEKTFLDEYSDAIK